MTQLSSKVCILGDFAVGKTSTVERFVNNHFSDKYLTTVGVKVDTKELALSPDVTLKLILWDVAGADRFGALELGYLRGAAGHLLVADGTRADTVQAALALKQQAIERYGEKPFVMLLNKADLEESWEIQEAEAKSLDGQMDAVFITSAKTGANVAEAIECLGQLVAAREFGAAP